MSMNAMRLLLPPLALLGMCSLAQAEQPPTVEIGAPIPITGPYAVDGQVMLKAIELAVDHLNEKGGVNGSEVSVRTFDIGDLTPDKLQAAASELVDRQNVAVLINGYGGMGPDIPAFCGREQPYLNNNATSAVVELTARLGCENIFMAADVERNYGRATFEQLMATGIDFGERRVAILHGPYDWEVGFTASVEEAAMEAGWTVTLTEEVPYGTTQWAAMMQKLRMQRPNLIVFETLDPASVSTFLDQFRKAPIAGAMVYAGYAVSTPALAEMISQGNLDGIVGMTLSAQRPGAQGEAFSAAWQEKFGEQPPLSIAGQVYDEVMLWAEAATRAGDATDYAKVRDEIMKISYAGVTGTLSFNDDYLVPVGDETQPSQFLQAIDGKIVPLMIGTQKVGEFVSPDW
ncbi:ABC transporter substrate-binding protein [Aquibium sp. A9E412]|uniref:ABC transporter substrate-binding protein n=1 Tax=Aquibium sp. A9E412 TaxID=2976767 RepID=UPI0025B0D867|nr:ABC transporter substrate-binding protein [Aquibium sp. A9E412]MDN2565761.1 ABC transporter substrate-binding protein [Aquibium sp. A9E412]